MSTSGNGFPNKTKFRKYETMADVLLCEGSKIFNLSGNFHMNFIFVVVPPNAWGEKSLLLTLSFQSSILRQTAILQDRFIIKKLHNWGIYFWSRLLCQANYIQDQEVTLNCNPLVSLPWKITLSALPWGSWMYSSIFNIYLLTLLCANYMLWRWNTE